MKQAIESILIANPQHLSDFWPPQEKGTPEFYLGSERVYLLGVCRECSGKDIAIFTKSKPDMDAFDHMTKEQVGETMSKVRTAMLLEPVDYLNKRYTDGDKTLTLLLGRGNSGILQKNCGHKPFYSDPKSDRE